ncbi:glycoside hydrolase family 3 protein [Patescibacteria group bacterium]
MKKKLNLKNFKHYILKHKLLFLLLFIIFLSAEYTLFIYKTNVEETMLVKGVSNIASSQVTQKYEAFRLESLVNLELKEMTTEEKIGQLFMTTITGNSINDDTRSLVEDYKVGNVILMSGNIVSQPLLSQLTSDLQDLSDTYMLIATDQEGGAVARIPWNSARLISHKHIGVVNRKDFAYEAGENQALTLKEYDLNMNLAPVLDVNFMYNSSLVSRTFSSDPDTVALLGTEYIKGHQENGIIATAKHFPGIGRTSTDSHRSLPEIDISKEELVSEELIPFQAAVNNNVDTIMVGHVLYSQIDSEYPSSLSKIIVTDILRTEMGFEGVVITDDIRMGALNDYPEKVIDAINAGVDIILIVDTYENQVEYIKQLQDAVEEGTVSEERINESVKRVLRLKLKYSVE